MIRNFARDLLDKLEGSFTLDTDDYSLEHEWRKLATGLENLLFALTAPHPSINEVTTRHGVDTPGCEGDGREAEITQCGVGCMMIDINTRLLSFF